MPRVSKTDEQKGDAKEDATPKQLPPNTLTVAQFEALSETERNAFRDSGGTVTNN